MSLLSRVMLVGHCHEFGDSHTETCTAGSDRQLLLSRITGKTPVSNCQGSRSAFFPVGPLQAV